MKKIFAFLLTLVLLFLFCVPVCGAGSTSVPDISAKSAALMTVDGNRLIYGKNEREKRGTASTTKILTALLALEYGSPKMEIVTTEQMVNVEGTSMGLLAGDTVTIEALVCGMLLQSGNDAAYTAAITISGSVEAFAGKMNQKAKELGMNDTHFVDPAGLWDEEHYSTAYDMALLGAYAIQNPAFAAVCSAKKVSLEYGNPPYTRTLYNHNRLLSAYEGAFGIKTGFTKKCGRCLVSAAERDGITLICVTLNDPNDWRDHKKLLDYGFTVCKKTALDGDFSKVSVPVAGGIVPTVSAIPFEEPYYAALSGTSEEIRRVVYLPQFLFAPVKMGDVIGRADYYLKDTLVKSVDLTAGFDVESTMPADYEEPMGFFGRIKDYIKDKFDGG